MAPVLQVDGLSLAFRHGAGWQRVLHDVSIEVRAGEVLGLVGESGCGKSSLAYLCLGYRVPGSRLEGGAVRFEGQDLLRLPRRALDRLRGRRVSFVPQNPILSLNPAMRIGSQVRQVLVKHASMPAAVMATREVELFASVGLPADRAARRRYPHQLSGGQQQRVTIAMALACDPALLVLDEPTTGLDVTTQQQLILLLADLRARLGVAMLYITHDLAVLAQIADRIAVMYAGHLVEMAPADEILRRARHPYARGLVASVPRLERQGRGGEPLPGVLQRAGLPPGCAFAPRCRHAEPACALTPQRPQSIAPGHEVACMRWPALAFTPPPATAPQATPQAAAWRPLLALEHLRLVYGRARPLLLHWLPARAQPVVSDLSLTIGRGEVFALVGESGSGKSTIAKAISGLLAPAAGRILYDGQALPPAVGRRTSHARRVIQYVFQNPDGSLNPRTRIRRILANTLTAHFPGQRAGFDARIAAALESVRLDDDYARRFPDQLSGGERQRVAIARALAAEPELLICDEILSALDVSVQASILVLLEALRRETRVAMLFISHDLAVVRSLADRVGVLYRGELCEVGPAAQVFAPPYHPYTHLLLTSVAGTGRGAPRAPAVPATPGPGCPFAHRCGVRAGPECLSTPPPWRESGSGLRIRCHLPADVLAALPAPLDAPEPATAMPA